LANIIENAPLQKMLGPPSANWLKALLMKTTGLTKVMTDPLFDKSKTRFYSINMSRIYREEVV
jgi:hypothetical protein